MRAIKIKHNMKLITILLTAFFLIQCNAPQTEGISFSETAFFQNENQDRWLENTKDDLQFLTYAENADSEKLNAFYQQKAKYIFLIGGGCFTATPKELEAKIAKDSLFIIWHEPNSPCPPVGKRSRANMALEIDKSLYPNYKNFKIIIKEE